MNHKIVKTAETEVLIYRDRTEENEEIVVVQAWKHYEGDPDEDEGIVYESHDFANADAAKAYVRDFSEASAEEFLIRSVL
ncbi:hypothetical protein EFA69_16070 [Rufibacter immobilis]|uniref:Uncharacterized protein n=1 Tax=Rufibacter immobilis TaxID=1348778 RepID=A0A3M9MRW9_9BACT|nr:hypothetical protein [Rufibacter immobilis]RNI27633.1 hypothetical protein EFA69_16070 [Rufibacter immobilis]